MDLTSTDRADQPRNDPRSVDELISAALVESDEDLIWDVVSALHWRGSAEVLEHASALCRSTCAVERELGADILGQLGVPDRTFPKACVSILLGMMDGEVDDDVLRSILIALGHLREPEAIFPASRFRDHPNPDIRHGVVHAMMGSEDPAAVATLIGLTRDPDPHNRDWATFALGSQIELNTPEIRDALAERLADEDEDTRIEARAGLARCKDLRMVEPLREALSSGSVSNADIEAATLIGDPRLYPELVALREWWDGSEDLEAAIDSARPAAPGPCGV